MNMIKGTKVLILFLFVSWTSIYSQQLDRQVLVPVAGLASGVSFNYSQTVGETAIVIVGCTDFLFTQGFQQPGIKVTPEQRPAGSGVKVYPNPVEDYLTIELFGNESRTFRIDIINMNGTIVFTDKKVLTDQFWLKEPYNIEKLIIGLYLVRIMSEDGIIYQTFKIEKI
jgi:hypothetical protein